MKVVPDNDIVREEDVTFAQPIGLTPPYAACQIMISVLAFVDDVAFVESKSRNISSATSAAAWIAERSFTEVEEEERSPGERLHTVDRGRAFRSLSLSGRSAELRFTLGKA